MARLRSRGWPFGTRPQCEKRCAYEDLKTAVHDIWLGFGFGFGFGLGLGLGLGHAAHARCRQRASHVVWRVVRGYGHAANVAKLCGGGGGGCGDEGGGGGGGQGG